MIVCGVDDAGRGSMLGPLVIAGISIDSKKLRKLKTLGVKDSKKLSPKIRSLIYDKILELSTNHYVTRIYPKTIDRNVSMHALNHLEAQYMAKVIRKLQPDIAYVDSCDVKPLRFGKEISRLADGAKVKSYHHADDKFLVVSAASIIAKVNRDRSIMRLRKKHDIGSGYPSDSKTVSFVRDQVLSKNDLPSFIRTSWKPVKELLSLQTSRNLPITNA
jgi:ribonuclease HII